MNSPSRLVLQYASVEAESLYGIQPADNAGFSPDNSSLPLLGTPGTAGTFTPGSSGDLGSGGVSGDQNLQPANATGPALARALESVWDGVKVLVRTPGTAMLVASLLGFLGSPLFVAMRRRRMLTTLTKGGR